MTNSFYTKKIAIGLLLAIMSIGKSQGASNLASGLFQQPEPYVSIDANYSKLLSQQVRFAGYGLGFDFESGLSLGLTLYRLRSKVLTSEYSLGAAWQFRISYLSVLAAYKLYEKDKLKVVAELGNGFGNVNFLELEVDRGRYGLYVFEPNLYTRYSILSWLGLAVQVGYRMGFTSGPPTVGELSSLKFDIGFTVMALPLYRAIKNRDFS